MDHSITARNNSQNITELQLQYHHLKRKKSENKLSNKLLQQIFYLMNTIGMKYLRFGNIQKAHSWLTCSYIYALNSRLIIVLETNLSCLCKKQHNYSEALEHMKLVQRHINLLYQNCQKGSKNDLYKIQADYQLNLCAIYSAQNKHCQSLNAARTSIRLLSTINDKKNLQLQIISRYNQAVELEHLKKYNSALKCYKKLELILKTVQYSKNLQQKIRKAILILSGQTKVKNNTNIIKIQRNNSHDVHHKSLSDYLKKKHSLNRDQSNHCKVHSNFLKNQIQIPLKSFSRLNQNYCSKNKQQQNHEKNQFRKTISIKYKIKKNQKIIDNETKQIMFDTINLHK